MPFIELLRSRRARLAAVAGAVLVAGCGGLQMPDWTPKPDAPEDPGARVTPRLPPPAGTARNWDDYRLKAARRLVAANPERVYDGRVPDVLLAIPVIEIELNADGSVRRLTVTRYPGQAEDTVALAMTAIRRAAPFGDVSHLPRPWKFNEVFLFNDDRRFKPRTLDD